MNKKLKTWLLWVSLITLLLGLIYVFFQQNFRSKANNPQLKIAQNLAYRLQNNSSTVLPQLNKKVDIAKSLGTFTIVYNDLGDVIFTNATLDGQTPNLPLGVLDYVKNNGEDKLTWQPKQGVRIAAVVERFNKGYVLAGRSLFNIEKMEDSLLLDIVYIWVALVIVITIYVKII